MLVEAVASVPADITHTFHLIGQIMLDHVLDYARLSPGITLVDVGAGDGLVAFRAIDRIGSALGAILVDISGPLLRHKEAKPGGGAAEPNARFCKYLQKCSLICPMIRLMS